MKRIRNIYLLTITAGALLPINGTNSALNNNYILSIRWDYILHALVYIPLFPLLVLGAISSEAKAQASISNKEVSGAGQLKGIRAFGHALFLAFILEAVQYLIPWRTFNVNDLGSNVLGVVFGLVIWLFIGKIINNKILR